MIVADDSRKVALEIRTWRKLAARERLRELADAPPAESDPELATLKCYLADWALLSEPVTLVRGAPGEVPYSDYMRATASWDLPGQDARLDASIRQAIDQAVYELTPRIPLCRAALMVRYMNRRGPAVYRSGWLQYLTRDEIEDLADESERALVPIVKRRGVYL